MKNRSPRDNTIHGITENIAEIERLPKFISNKQEEIKASSGSLDAMIAIEKDYASNKIPYQQRQITALTARIAMLQLPVDIEAIREKVKADAATIAAAENERDENERTVQPYRDEHKKIAQAISLLVSLAYNKNALASSISSLEAKTAELGRLKNKLAELEPRRNTAHQTAIISKEKFDGLDQELAALRKRHRAEEEPHIEVVNQIKNRLGSLQARLQTAQQNQSNAHHHQHEEEATERKHLEKSQQALRDKQKFHAHAEEQHHKKRSLLAELESQRSAYESAKQAAAYSSNAGSGGYGSSSNAAPPSTTTDTINVPTGFGGSIQVPTPPPPSTFSSDQGGSNSNTSYSANVSNNGNILEGMLQKISQLERDIQSTEEEARRYERKAASEHDDARNHEATAATAHQRANNYADQTRTYTEQASSLQTEIVHVNGDYERELDKLHQVQQRIRSEDSRLSKAREAAHQQYQQDQDIFVNLNSQCVDTAKNIENTNRVIHNLNRDIANTRINIDNNEASIHADAYATQHSHETLIAMRQEQERLAQPYLSKIQECKATINETASQKQSKERQIEELNKRLRTAISTVEQLTPEFAGICSNEDIANLQKQSNVANGDLSDLRKQLTSHQEKLSSNRGQLNQLQAELKQLQERERSLHAADLLMKLYQDPGSLLTTLHHELLRTVNDYAATHHIGLNWQSRSSLLSLIDRANFILHNQNVDGQTENEKLREKFYQLSGLIRNEMEFVNGNASYFNVLSGLLMQCDIEERDVVGRFHSLEKKHAQPLHIMNFADITNHDANQYRLAKEALNHLLAAGPQQNTRKWRSLYRAGKSMTSCIEKEERKVRAPNEIQFDVHLHTRIFQLSAEVLQHPDNAAARTELHNLTQHNRIGQASTPRKVIGAILAFIGAAAALVGGLALAGLIPVISLPIAAPMIAGGGAGVAAGLFTFFSGLERGLSRAYRRFDNISAELGNQMPPAPAPAPTQSEHPQEYFDPPKPSAPPFTMV